jgi:TolA-binding protein
MADFPDLSKPLDDLKREVIESRNMTIKTDNALKTLHAELKAVSAQQDAFQRRTWFSTGIAYLVFAGLCVAGVVVISNTRAAAATAEKDRLEKQAVELNATIDKLRAEAATQAQAEQGALGVYKQMTTLPGEERLKGIDALAKLDQSKLTALAKLVLADRSVMLRKEVGQVILEKGKAAFRRQDYAEAANHLGRFLTMDPPEDDALEAAFFLGNSLFQVRKFEDAIKPLARFIDGDKKSKLRDFSMTMLMQAYDMVGKKDEAVAVAKEAFNTYPASDFRLQFLTRIQRANTAAAAPVAAPVAAPAPVAPAPTPAPATPAPGPTR